MRHFVFLLLLVGWSSFALADRASEARDHYQNATSHFAVGEFAEAAAEYQAAFKLKPDPALLYNAAQSYRLANNPEKALILYKNYLQLYPNEPNADEVRRQIDKVKEAIAAAESAKTSPPTGTNEPKQLPPPTTPESPPQTAQAPVSVAPVAEKHETPVYKKWWLWTIVGAVVAGGVVTAAVLATRPSSSWSNAPDVGPGSSNALVRW
ncbi:MAG TPA: tetratricopeptide repeat protein [Polyangia bacterium]|nr:tetratricopeptide repeat protein [Polyangia bacterium]